MTPRQVLDQKDRVQIVDVREPVEWAATYLAGAGCAAHNMDSGMSTWQHQGPPVEGAAAKPSAGLRSTLARKWKGA